MVTMVDLDLRRFEACLVDLDGTLYAPRPLKALMAAELLVFGSWHISALREFRRQHELLRQEQATKQTAAGEVPEHSPFELQLQRSAVRLGRSVDELRPVVHTWMVERPTKWLSLLARKGLLHELREYQTGGGKLALVSDYPARHKLRAFQRWLEFDTIVANGEQNGPSRLKPDPAGYLKAAELLGVPAERCLVIGDREDADGAAAAAAGMAFKLV